MFKWENDMITSRIPEKDSNFSFNLGNGSQKKGTETRKNFQQTDLSAQSEKMRPRLQGGRRQTEDALNWPVPL